MEANVDIVLDDDLDRLLHLIGLNNGGTDTTAEVEDGEVDVVVCGGPDGDDAFDPQQDVVVVSPPAPPTPSESAIDVGDGTPDDPPVMAHTESTKAKFSRVDVDVTFALNFSRQITCYSSSSPRKESLSEGCFPGGFWKECYARIIVVVG